MAEVSFGEWLKRRRNALGLTQEQLARQINCSTSALRKFEAELRRPSADVIEQLVKVFNIPQAEQKSFLRFARGDWQAMSDGDDTDAPWHASSVQVEKPKETVTPRNNLPLQLTSFIGREKEITEIINLITTHRFVTLVGTGGIGKTRLSLEVAHEVLNTFPDGVWFIEFAPLADANLIAQVTINTLGLIEQANRTPQTILMDFLKDKHALLILDNCEHLIQACAQLAETLLRACPNLKILATSREVLNILGETTWMASTLSLPDVQQSVLPDTLMEYDAIRLFVERASATLPSFALNTQNNAVAIAQVCQRLDGLPLAIELAAVHVRALTVEQIAAHLHSRFQLLASGNRGAPPRHQTLAAMIDWSYNLLPTKQQSLFQRLSIFAGGWTLEAAEAICSGSGIELSEIPTLLSNLVNNSLVIAQTQDELPRYHMLETIRQYAHEKLWAASEGELIRKKHLDYFVDLAERAEPHLRAFGMIEWLDRLETELDNIRVALNYALESNIEAQLRIASALLWFWHIRGRRNEGVDWLERGLSIEKVERGSQSLTSSRARIRGRALNASGSILQESLSQKAKERFEESLDLFKGLGTGGKQGMAFALDILAGWKDRKTGKVMREQSLALFQEVNDKFGAAQCLMNLASVARVEYDLESAIAIGHQQLALRKEIGDMDGIAIAQAHLGNTALRKGAFQQAISLYEESLSGFRAVGNKWGIGLALAWLGIAIQEQGNYEQAAKMLEQALTYAKDLADERMITERLDELGKLAWEQGSYELAIKRFEEERKISREAGNNFATVRALQSLGRIAQAQADDVTARSYYSSAIHLASEMRNEWTKAICLSAFASLAATQRKPDKAARLIGAAEILVPSLRFELSAKERAEHNQAIAATRAALGEEAFMKLWEEGKKMTLDEAVALALSDS